jgi:hypothetical protein
LIVISTLIVAQPIASKEFHMRLDHPARLQARYSSSLVLLICCDNRAAR